ncbi:Clp protease ClpP [Oscillospiraceae bacterium 38-13]
MRPTYFAVQQADREADVYLFGDIVADRWSEEDTSAFSLKETIKSLDVDVINVHIDSRGGVVSEGWAIYNELRRHPALIRTYGKGFVASAALYPFMAGDERYAMDPSAYFFHQALSRAEGNADDLRKAADELEKLNLIGLSAFTENTRLTAEEVLEMERRETWLSPQEALELGIATAILKPGPAAVPVQSVTAAVLQRLFLPQEEQKPEQKEPNIMKLLGAAFSSRPASDTRSNF